VFSDRFVPVARRQIEATVTEETITR